MHHENAYLLILRRPSGKTIFCNILQPVKADDLIFRIIPEKMTSSNLSQFMKQDFSTNSTLGGILILCKFVQDEKADSPIYSTFSGIMISLIFVQWQNENIPISTTVSGIVNEETLEHPKNASFPIFFSFFGKTIDGIALQLKKTDSSNFLMFRGITIGFSII
jgi:hypothetical protein